jgi:ribosome-associated toxin RatA of RatAB toxin-antitoxin module
MRPQFLLYFLFASACSFAQKAPDDWTLEREKKGIKIFTKKSKWSKLKDSKATMLVDATPQEMLNFVTDFESYPKWMYRCKSANKVAHISENEFIAHITFNAPWPVKDRDCVLRVLIERNEKSGAISITKNSEPRFINKRDGVVRIEQIKSVWHFVPDAKSGKTLVINEYSSDPGGGIPDWLTNTQSVESPWTTFTNLQNVLSVEK